MPSAADLLSDMAELPASITSAYIPDELPQLADYCIVLIKLSKILGEIPTFTYKPLGASPTFQEFNLLQEDLLQFQIPGRPRHKQSRLAAFYLYHLQLHYQASLITFYRPYITRIPEKLPFANVEAWQSEIRSKLDSVALQSNSILNDLVRERLLGFAGPMTPTLLGPALYIHLLNYKSADALTSRLGFNKLELCMMVMEELEETYAAAAVYRGLFLGAINHLHPYLFVGSGLQNSDASDLSTSRMESPKSSAILPTVSDDVINPLLDRSLTFGILLTTLSTTCYINCHGCELF